MSNFKKYVNVFEFETELLGTGETIKFKPITTGQIKKLLVYESSEDVEVIENALDSVINECVINENFNIDDLYLQDRFYLLVELRKATKGNIYSFQSKCNKCNSQTVQNIDISKLKLTKLNNENENWNIVELSSDLKVKLSHLTRGKIKELRAYLETLKLKGDLKDAEESLLMYAYAISSIITPDGEEDDVTVEDKMYLINNMSQGIIDTITEWFTNTDFGIDFNFDVDCIHCENKENKSIPIENFFY